MRQKREIHAIDYVIVELVAALDVFLRSEFGPHKSMSGGLNVIIKDTEFQDHTVEAFVKPTSWPSGNIYIQINPPRGKWGWQVFEGRIMGRLPSNNKHDKHLQFAFKCNKTSSGLYKFTGVKKVDEELVAELAANRD